MLYFVCKNKAAFHNFNVSKKIEFLQYTSIFVGKLVQLQENPTSYQEYIYIYNLLSCDDWWVISSIKIRKYFKKND